MRKLTKILFGLVIGFAMTFSSYGQETVYCIADVNTNPPPIHAYGVLGATLLLPPVIATVPYLSNGPVGLTMDEVNGVLFDLGFKRFSLRGKTKVNAQWQLISMVHNILKIHRYGWN